MPGYVCDPDAADSESLRGGAGDDTLPEWFVEFLWETVGMGCYDCYVAGLWGGIVAGDVLLDC